MNGPARGGKLLANFNSVMAANVAAGAINFVAIAWFARQLGPTTMGDYALVATAVQVVSAFLSGGFDQAVIRDPENPGLWAAANVAVVAQSGLLVLVCGGGYYVLSLLGLSWDTTLLLPGSLIVGSIILSLYAYLFAAPIAARLEYRYLSLMRLGSAVAGVVVGLVLVGLDAGIYALALRDLSAALLMLLLVKRRSLRRLDWRIGRAGLRDLFAFAKPLWGLNVLERLAVRIDYLLVGAMLGKEVLGMYYVVRGLVEGVLGFLVSPVQTVLYAHYCRSVPQARLPRMFSSRAVAIYGSLVALLALGAFYTARGMIGPLLGAFYLPAYGVVPGLVLYAGCILWFEGVKVFAMSRGWHRRLLWARLIQISAAAVAIYPMVRQFGLPGAGIATAIGGAMLAAAAWRSALTAARSPAVRSIA